MTSKSEEVDSEGNHIKYLCGFNLLSGALHLDSTHSLGLYVPRPYTSNYISAPIINSFDDTLYDADDPNSIVAIMNSFSGNNNIIGYQRIGDRREELTKWIITCNSLTYIRDLF